MGKTALSTARKLQKFEDPDLREAGAGGARLCIVRGAPNFGRFRACRCTEMTDDSWSDERTKLSS
eukprot:1321695-Alexandrium_andersonii.AAC.1